MSASHSRIPCGPRARRLPACIASILTLSAPAIALATNRPVTSCLDDGSAGTLRSVITAASTVSGDTVDLSALTHCPGSKITLATGGSRIDVIQNSLVIKGPVASTLTIDASQLYGGVVNDSNVFFHTGTGTLTVKYLSVTGGHESSRLIDSRGGCIYSSGNVSLIRAHLSSCSAYSRYYAGKGGAVYALGNIAISGGTISGNSAASGSEAVGGAVAARGNVTIAGATVIGNTVSSAGPVKGGGVYAHGNFDLQYAILSGNSAVSPTAIAEGGGARVNGDTYAHYATVSNNYVATIGPAYGGAMSLAGSVTIANSTVSGNSSSEALGGLDVFASAPSGKTFVMRNSTVSGNHAATVDGSLYVNSGTAKFYNSTIAFNTAGIARPGLVLAAPLAPMAVTLQSTLMSNNTYGPTENDLVTIDNPDITFNGGPANNLIRITGAGGLPGDTKFITCPLLGPLRDNGGLTQTHALWSGSIAIDNGNDALIDPDTALPYANDQRGSLATNGTRDYVRVSGLQADIGAYELQQDDIVFGGGFDGCP